MNLKKLMEMREQKSAEMRALIDTANTEERALNNDEIAKFEELETEIRNIDKSIGAIQTQRDLGNSAPAPEERDTRTEEQRDYDNFDAFIRNTLEVRAEEVFSHTENGAVIPATIASKIIQKVVDMCPIYSLAERYNVKGTLTIPYYDESTGDITMAYADEWTEGDATGGQFKSIPLTGYLARAIAEVSKSLINNSQFDVVNFVVNRMALSIALFIEKELLQGTEGKVAGLKAGVTQVITTTSATALTGDDLIDVQESVPDVYQTNAIWIMNKATRTAIRKLKDADGNYILNRDMSAKWGYTLLGKDVYTSDNMDKIGTGKTVAYYGDMSGLAVKVSEEISIEVLRETKARKHVIEVLGFVEFDGKVQDAQKISALKMK